MKFSKISSNELELAKKKIMLFEFIHFCSFSIETRYYWWSLVEYLKHSFIFVPGKVWNASCVDWMLLFRERTSYEVLIKFLFERIGYKKSRYIWILIQGLLFCVFSVLNNIILSIGILFGIGIANATSNVSYQTLLHSNIPSELKGKVMSVKLFLYSLISILLIPVVTNIFDKSIKVGLISSGTILLILGIVIRKSTLKVLK